MAASDSDNSPIPEANRHRVAVCLRALRKGIGVETTCKQHGWNTQSIWNDTVRSPAYRRIKDSQPPKHPHRRINHRKLAWVGRRFPLERQFSDHIESLLIRHGVDYEREPKVKAGLSRADFRMHRSLIKCKSDVSTMAMNKALGQCWIYKGSPGKSAWW